MFFDSRQGEQSGAASELVMRCTSPQLISVNMDVVRPSCHLYPLWAHRSKKEGADLSLTL